VESLNTPRDALRQPFVVTLVHGTLPLEWMRRCRLAIAGRAYSASATWIQPGSPMWKALSEALPGLELRSFEWSGANSPKARAAAARKLTSELEGMLDRFPKARHFVIAHSHGGNVALYTLRSGKVREGLSGIACLATPFITVIDRMGCLLPMFVAFLYMSSLVSSGVLAFWLVLHFGAGIAFPDWRWWLASIVPVSMVILGLSHLAGKRAGYWQREVQLPNLDSLPRNRLLIIKGVADEAGTFLGASQFVSWGGMLAVRRAAGVVGGVYGAFDVLGRRHFIRRFKLVERVWQACAVVAVLIASVLVGFVLSPVTVTVVVVSLFTWGPRLGFLSPLLELSAETPPPGRWEVHQLAGHRTGDVIADLLDEFGLNELEGLSHSGVYSDARALQAIVDWIKTKAACDSTGVVTSETGR
jgi:hypothetical protein